MGKTALFFAVGKPPQVIEIEEAGLANLQRLCGGFIDMVRLDQEIVLYCNDEGLLNGMEPNVWAEGPTYRGAPVHGPAVVVGFSPETGDDRSLTEIEVERWRKLARLAPRRPA